MFKNKITSDIERDRGMFTATRYQESCTNYGVTSNEPWFLPAEDNDRRYFALSSSITDLLNHPLYKAMFPRKDEKTRIDDYYTALTASLTDNNNEGLNTLA